MDQLKYISPKYFYVFRIGSSDSNVEQKCVEYDVSYDDLEARIASRGKTTPFNYKIGKDKDGDDVFIFVKMLKRFESRGQAVTFMDGYDFALFDVGGDGYHDYDTLMVKTINELD